MSSLQDALLRLNSGVTIEQNVADNLNSVFLNNKTAWVKEAVDSYLKYNTDPNESIGKIATQYNLNGDQVQRLVEETNVGIYLDKYAATKGAKTRRVEFNLADAQKIGVVTQKVAEDHESFVQALEKVANETCGNAFTTDSDKYDVQLWDKASRDKVAAEALKRKLAGKIVEEKKAALVNMQGLLSKIAFIAESLIYNERAEGDAQYLFDKIASTIDCDKPTLTAISSCVNKKMVIMKEARLLPGNMSLGLNIPTEITDAEYSLGKHSLSKQAEDEYVVKTKHLPDKVTYEKLVQVAREIKDELDKSKTKGPVEVKVV